MYICTTVLPKLHSHFKYTQLVGLCKSFHLSLSQPFCKMCVCMCTHTHVCARVCVRYILGTVHTFTVCRTASVVDIEGPPCCTAQSAGSGGEDGAPAAANRAVKEAKAKYKHILGDRCAVLVTGGASTGAAVKEFLQNVMTVLTIDGYGTTEVCVCVRACVCVCVCVCVFSMAL